MAHLIFYWEALTVLAAVEWAASLSDRKGSKERPLRLTIRSDSSNSVDIFNSLSALPLYNPILIQTVDILIEHHIDLRVIHIPGSENAVADALSRSDFELAQSLQPGLSIQPFQPPRTVVTLGAAEK
ncbi:hypothetical protein EV360DRAFT_90880 [Lentinula raphanica]|nr:hypothetical protein EV360DRAFT_90880 [Lentinula raphanica]